MPALNPNSAHPSDKHYDVIVIGGGMGGLIAACQLALAGKRVALIENLSFVGGRFTAFKVDGAEIPSGAFHTFPHGARGPFAQALRRCQVNVKIPTPCVFASFYVGGKHVVAKTGFDVFRVVQRRADKLMLWRVLLQSWVTLDNPGTFGDWLISLGASEAVRTIFDRFCQFSLSTTLYDVPYKEGRSVIESTIQYGLPGVPVGGAREVAKQLTQVATKVGVTILKRTQAKALLAKEGKAAGVVVLDRSRNETNCLFAPTIISDIGPANTYHLVETADWEDGNSFSVPQRTPPAAIGLKIQVQSPKSLIEHDGIMFCLDTKRIAGILQATNIDPSLAAPGQHLLISHQVIAPGADWQTEKHLALDDWRYIFGRDFEQCEVVGWSQFPATFPVNWATQGFDVRNQPFSQRGLWMVGDGVKPQGLMMAEGVAASAENVVAEILGSANKQPWKLSLQEQVREWGRRIVSGQQRT